MFYTKKKARRLRIEIYSTVGAATAINAGIAVSGLVMSGKNRKDIKQLKEKTNDMEMHLSKEEEQTTRLVKAVRTLQDSAMEHGLLRK